MSADRNDPLAVVLGGLSRLTPSAPRAARIHARCARLYDAPRDPPPRPSRSGALVFGVLSLIYLGQLARVAARVTLGGP